MMDDRPKRTPHALIILDGWGYREQAEFNAILQANTPVWDRLWRDCPHCLIASSGTAVGLPPGQMGNSEVGHMNLGAGRIVHQTFTRITKAVDDGSFYSNPVLSEAAAKGNNIHLFGLLSPGGVHSHEDQIKAAVELAFKQKANAVYMHAFLDGRDVPPRSAATSLNSMDQHIKKLGSGGVVSGVGRYYAMDRDKRWERTEQAYHLVCRGEAQYSYPSVAAALDAAYQRDESDEFIKPTRIEVADKPIQICDDDTVIFMNFRADRARQLSRAFTEPSFDEFSRKVSPQLAAFVTLTQYSEEIDAPYAFGPIELPNGMAEYLSSLNKSQLRIAETEKYAHVTFFFSGGREEPFAAEERILVPSPKVATYDLQPDMSAPEVTDRLVEAITSGQYDAVICNYANSDMVGHTGDLQAAIKAVECVDQCLGRVVKALKSIDGEGVITADHGNVELMRDDLAGQPHTAHTVAPVPFVYIGQKEVVMHRSDGILADVAPTLLTLMGLPIPTEMTGQSILQLSDSRTSDSRTSGSRTSGSRTSGSE